MGERYGETWWESTKMNSFKDSSLRNGIFLIDLLNGIRPGIVDYNLVKRGISGIVLYIY